MGLKWEKRGRRSNVLYTIVILGENGSILSITYQGKCVVLYTYKIIFVREILKNSIR